MQPTAPRIVVLSPGAKVGLTRAIRTATDKCGGVLFAWESDPWSPAAPFCQERVKGCAVEDAAAIQELLAWCERESIDLVIPTRHDDLPALASATEDFKHAGTELAIASSACVRLSIDKRDVHRWLAGHHFPTPEQTTIQEWEDSPLRGQFPAVAKDPVGSGSRGLRRIDSAADLAGLPDHWLVQSLAPGDEYTVNVFVDRRGRSVCEIPHQRIMVSEGEVVRGRTTRNPQLMEIARKIAEQLPGARGPLNIQIFWDDRTECATVIEINPRFGGGFPLVNEAGGRFAEWIIDDWLGPEPPARCDDWEDGLIMIRYRESVFIRK